MAAFHQLILGEKKKKKVMRHMSESALAASLLMCQNMSWGWMIDNANATLWVFKFDSSAFFVLFLSLISVFHLGTFFTQAG